VKPKTTKPKALKPNAAATAPKFFATASAFRAWLEKHHATADELLVGMWKRGSGKPSMTWPESVEQALCFGWIDGVRRTLDEESYSIRFTPRRPTSIWSKVNVAKVAELTEQGLMRPAGLAAFARRTEEKTGIYSAEQKDVRLGDAFEKEFRKRRAGWSFFEKQPAWYRRTAIWWVIGAKREETRRRRFDALLDACDAADWFGPAKGARGRGPKSAR
jgi:uncharacterized protein YdeI (YjbR/CyaY-like superfamily)